MKKLAIITTHPIQYNAPFFKLLSDRNNIDIKVFYTWSQIINSKKFDPGFGQNIEWDIPLLDGYNYSFVTNIANSPGSHHYYGINNPTLTKEVQEWGANAILIYGWNFKSHLSAIHFFYKRIPVFFRGDSTLLNEKKGLKKIIRRTFLKFVYSHINYALYAGIANKAYFKAMGLHEKQLVFMPHAIDNNRFATNDKHKNHGLLLKNKLGITSNGLVFLFAGKLDYNKNVGLLIDAFIALNTKEDFLLITGNGSEETNLKNKSKHHSNIKFLDFQNQLQMPSLYAFADVFVLPSKTETWGLSINEAMAAGKPIIATNTCGAAFDLIKKSENGFLFNCNDTLSLTTALSFFIENKNSAKLMGMASLKIIKEYSYSQDCDAIEKLMNRKESLSNK